MHSFSWWQFQPIGARRWRGGPWVAESSECGAICSSRAATLLSTAAPIVSCGLRNFKFRTECPTYLATLEHSLARILSHSVVDANRNCVTSQLRSLLSLAVRRWLTLIVHICARTNTNRPCSIDDVILYSVYPGTWAVNIHSESHVTVTIFQDLFLITSLSVVNFQHTTTHGCFWNRTKLWSRLVTYKPRSGVVLPISIKLCWLTSR